ncbi:hypothetical protein THAOC_31111, partial [Thalassiosira oceanica]
SGKKGGTFGGVPTLCSPQTNPRPTPLTPAGFQVQIITPQPTFGSTPTPDQDQEQRKRGREKRGGERREGGEGKREKEWCYLFIHGAHSRTGVVVSASFSRRRQRLKRGSQALVVQSSLLLPSVHEAVEFTHCTAKPIDPHLAPVLFSEPRPSST